jgi:hypothetical protein
MSGGDPVSWFLIEEGWSVMNRVGREIGRVTEVLGDKERDIFDGLAISLGLLEANRYLAAEDVGRIEEGTVHAEVDDAAALAEYDPKP